MTYEQAKELALRKNAKINACKEYENAYRFYDKFDQTERIPDDDVVVLKDTGKLVNLTTFILDYHPKPKPKSRIF